MVEDISINNILLLLTIVVSLVVGNDPYRVQKLAFMPYHIIREKEYFRFITSGLIHADMAHLFFNMLALYSFGRYVEMVFGSWLYLVFYVVALVVSSVPAYFKHLDNPGYSAIGASGAVSAVVLALILMHPTLEVLLFFVIPLPGFFFAGAYLVYSYYMAGKSLDNIGHEAHLTGALFGIAFTLIFVPGVLGNFIESLANYSFFD